MSNKAARVERRAEKRKEDKRIAEQKERRNHLINAPKKPKKT